MDPNRKPQTLVETFDQANYVLGVAPCRLPQVWGALGELTLGCILKIVIAKGGGGGGTIFTCNYFFCGGGGKVLIHHSFFRINCTRCIVF